MSADKKPKAVLDLEDLCKLAVLKTHRMIEESNAVKLKFENTVSIDGKEYKAQIVIEPVVKQTK